MLQVALVSPEDPKTKGMVYQVNQIAEANAATTPGMVYRAKAIYDPSDPHVKGMVHQITLVTPGPSVKGKVYNVVIDGSLLVPDDYEELECLESDGTKYIDTGIKLASTDIVETEFKNTTANDYGAVYGVYAIGQSSAFYANVTYYGYDVTNNKVNTNIAVDTAWHKIRHDFIDGVLSVDGVNTEFTPFEFTNTVNNYLFARYYNGSYGYGLKGCIKRYKVYREGVLILDLVPCERKVDNAQGMFDRVSETFVELGGGLDPDQ